MGEDRAGDKAGGKAIKSGYYMIHNKHAINFKKLDNIDERATEGHEMKYNQVASYEHEGDTRNERRKLIWEKQVEQCESSETKLTPMSREECADLILESTR